MPSGNLDKTIGVTGANGLLGRHLCARFHQEGWTVHGWVRNTSVYPFDVPGVRLVRCNLPDEIDRSSLQGMDVLVHCAYMTRFTDLSEAKRVNEEGTAKLLECARQEGVGRFVFVSSNSARADAPSYYARSKHNLEQIMDPQGDVVLRPGLILAADGGLFCRIAALVKRLPILPVFSGGEQKIKTVHVDDLCEAFVRCIQEDAHGEFTVTEPDGVTMRRLLLLMAAKLQRRRLILPLPATPFLVVLRFFESLGLRLPVSSENLLGLLALPNERSVSQLEPFGVSIRTAEQSISDLVDSLFVG